MNKPENPQSPTRRANRPPAPRPTTQMMVGCLVIPVLVAIALVGVFTYERSRATARLTVPDRDVLLVRALPNPTAPLLARFGPGHTVRITGRTPDWRWLEVELWAGQRGWTLRPLDILVWQLNAAVVTPRPVGAPVPVVTPAAETMVAIPAVTFTMGSPPGLGEPDEHPARTVTLSAFEIDQTEVTLGRYWACVEAGVCPAPAGEAGPVNEHYLNSPAFDNYPVVNVSWTGANRYCGWRDKRLPTEAEWEMAAGWDARRGAKLLWPWGNSAEQVQINAGSASTGQPAPAGSFSGDRSPAGVLDMGGNVSEWVFDWYKVDYYRVADNTDPLGPTYRRGEGSGRVVRGASFADSLEQARTANRNHRDAEYGYPTVGFRCARDATP